MGEFILRRSVDLQKGPETKEAFSNCWLPLLLTTLRFSLPGLCLALLAPAREFLEVGMGQGFRHHRGRAFIALFFAAPPSSSWAWLAKRGQLAGT